METGLERSLEGRARFRQARERRGYEGNKAPERVWQMGVTGHILALGHEVSMEAQMIQQAGLLRKWTWKVKQRHLDPKEQVKMTVILWNVFRWEITWKN